MSLMRRVFLALFALLLVVPLAAAPAVHLPDLDNHLVDPFLAAESSKAIVFLFASVDCPISNRYAPVVQRLYQTFAPQGVTFWLIYPNPAETPAAILYTARLMSAIGAVFLGLTALLWWWRRRAAE